LTILPLDALHPAKAGKPAVVGDLEEVAVASSQQVPQLGEILAAIGLTLLPSDDRT
jgi:hypothetical protein